MTVFADDVFGIRNDGAVNKLVVIWVLLDQTKTELRIVASTERAFQYCMNNILCDVGRGQLCKDFGIFRNDFITDTGNISSLTKSIP